MRTNQKKLPKSQIEIEFELSAEEFGRHFEHALEHMKKHVKVDGFRPGQAPNKIVEEKIGNENLLMEAGDHAVNHVYSDYVKENKLEPVGQPEVKILKIAKGSEFIFTVTVAILPDVELPDYKEIAESVIRQSADQKISVTDQEIEDSLKYLQKTRAKFTAKNEPAEKKDFVEIKYSNKEIGEGKDVDDQFILGEAGFMKGFEEQIIGMRSGEEKTFDLKEEDFSDRGAMPDGRQGPALGWKVKVKSVQKMELPEINDEFAKQLGSFDTLAALKGSIKQGIEMEKTEQEKQRKRGEILEKIAEKTKIELPDAMIEYEKKNLMEDLKQKISQNMKGFSAQGAMPDDRQGPASGWEQYLAAIKKTEAEIKETFQKEAEKRLRGFLVLRELGKKENIEVTDVEVEEEVSKSLGRSTGEAIKNFSKEQLDKIDIEQLKEYTKNIIHNEKVFQRLECQ